MACQKRAERQGRAQADMTHARALLHPHSSPPTSLQPSPALQTASLDPTYTPARSQIRTCAAVRLPSKRWPPHPRRLTRRCSCAASWNRKHTLLYTLCLCSGCHSDLLSCQLWSVALYISSVLLTRMSSQSACHRIWSNQSHPQQPQLHDDSSLYSCTTRSPEPGVTAGHRHPSAQQTHASIIIQLSHHEWDAGCQSTRGEPHNVLLLLMSSGKEVGPDTSTWPWSSTEKH
ncbi:hypothetical protein V8E55_005136 [Tylopilus felleus]